MQVSENKPSYSLVYTHILWDEWFALRAPLANLDNYEEGREECLIIVSGGRIQFHTLVCIVTMKIEDLHHVGILFITPEKKNLVML